MEAETRYHPNADQLALASTIEESLAPLLPLSRLHASQVEDAQTWSNLDDIGIFGISVGEEQGGSGLGAAEEALIVMALGQRLAAPAVFATIGATHARLGVTRAFAGEARASAVGVAHASAGLADTPPGTAVAALRGRRAAAAYRRGARIIIVEDAAADLLLLRDGSDAALYALGSCVSRTIDDRLWIAGLREVVGSDEPVGSAPTTRLGRAGSGEGSDVSARGAAQQGATHASHGLTREGQPRSDVSAQGAAQQAATLPLGEPIARFEAPQVLRLRLIDAAALAGISQAAVDMSVAYAGTRAQFGRPIGSFQAVKHHCANMVSAARRARDQTCFAAVAIDEGRADAALQVECALFVAGSAALENAGKNIQIHGGMGFSDEADPHLLLKRTQLLSAIAGGLEAANERIANIKAGW